ncbi:hypothetical protein FQA39_LY09594 [Lamprigera yunnana]|nr:hypothetical protein FQA39_LY09594 [Lamprigera yunnana]
MDEIVEDDVQSAEKLTTDFVIDSEIDVNENAKRLKIEKCDNSNNILKSSSSSEQTTEFSDSTEQESPNTSTSDSAFPRVRNLKTRHYRSYVEDDSSRSTTYDNDEEPSSEGVRTSSDSDLDPLSDSTAIETSSSTEMHDSELDTKEHPMLKNFKPKHNWFIIPEVTNRQIGCSAKTRSSMFQRRYYGSLHCAQRLELMYKLEKHEGCVNTVNFHPNGSLLVSGSDDLRVIVWDWKRGTTLLTFDTKHRGNIFQTKFLPLSGDLHIVTCARDGQVRLYQVSAQEGLRGCRKLGAHKGPCHKIALLNDQPQIILSAGEDGLVFSHDLRSSKPDKIVSVEYENHKVPLYSISSHPLNNYEFCVSGQNHIVRSYDQRKCGDDCSPLNTFNPTIAKKEYFPNRHVTCALYNNNGTEILASYNDNDIYVFDTNGTPGSFVHNYRGHRNSATIKGVNYFGPNSEFIVSGSDCGHLFIWEKNTESIVNWMLADDAGVVNCVEPHPHLPFLCTSGLDWDIKLWIPSCETDPDMIGLASAVHENTKTHNINHASGRELNESQMLWILWRHLRNTNQLSRASLRTSDFFELDRTSEGTVSDSSSSSNAYVSDDSDSNSDEYNDSAGCTAS